MVERLDEAFARRAQARQSTLTKPPGSLGRLEDLAVRLAAIQRSDRPSASPRAVVVFVGDHGVTAEGVSPYPSEVTGQMIANFAAGGAAVNALARVARAEVSVVDTRSVRERTGNIAREDAMSPEELEAAMAVGAAEARRLSDHALVALGEMGIGNTTPASALTSRLTGRPAKDVTGTGTGLDPEGLARKVEVVERALARHDAREPLEMLRTMGGTEIAALAGFCLEAHRHRTAIVVDGFITTAAFGVAWKTRPELLDFAFFAHRSVEPGHAALLEWIGAEPLLDLGLRLGEGTGAALALPLLEAAAACHNEMATFGDAGVSDRDA